MMWVNQEAISKHALNNSTIKGHGNTDRNTLPFIFKCCHDLTQCRHFGCRMAPCSVDGFVSCCLDAVDMLIHVNGFMMASVFCRIFLFRLTPGTESAVELG